MPQNATRTYAEALSLAAYSADLICHRLSRRARGFTEVDDVHSAEELNQFANGAVSLWNESADPAEQIEALKLYTAATIVHADKSEKANRRTARRAWYGFSNELSPAPPLHENIYEAETAVWGDRLKKGGIPPLFDLFRGIGRATDRIAFHIVPEGGDPEDSVSEPLVPRVYIREENVSVESNGRSSSSEGKTYLVDTSELALVIAQDQDINSAKSELKAFVSAMGRDGRGVKRLKTMRREVLESVSQSIKSGMLSTSLEVALSDALSTINERQLITTAIVAPDGPANSSLAIIYSLRPVRLAALGYFAALLPMVTHMAEAAVRKPPKKVTGDDRRTMPIRKAAKKNGQLFLRASLFHESLNHASEKTTGKAFKMVSFSTINKWKSEGKVQKHDSDEQLVEFESLLTAYCKWCSKQTDGDGSKSRVPRRNSEKELIRDAASELADNEI